MEKKELNVPKMSTDVSISKDKKWLIHKTVIISFTAMKYFEKVLAS